MDHLYVHPAGGGDLISAEIAAAARAGHALPRHPRLHEPVAEGRRAAARLGGAGRRHDPGRVRAPGRPATTIAAPGAMVQVALAPCSPFSVTPGLMRATAELAERLDVRLHTHLAEDVDEDRYCLDVYGCRPVEHFEDVGWGTRPLVGGALRLPQRRRDRAAGGVGHRRGPLPELEPDDRRRAGPGARVPRRRACPSASAATARPRPTRPRCGWRAATPCCWAGCATGPRPCRPATRSTWPPWAAPRCLGRQARSARSRRGAAGDLAVWPLEGVAFAGALSDPIEAWLRCGPTARPPHGGGRAVDRGRRPAWWTRRSTTSWPGTGPWPPACKAWHGLLDSGLARRPPTVPARSVTSGGLSAFSPGRPGPVDTLGYDLAAPASSPRSAATAPPWSCSACWPCSWSCWRSAPGSTLAPPRPSTAGRGWVRPTARWPTPTAPRPGSTGCSTPPRAPSRSSNRAPAASSTPPTRPAPSTGRPWC